MISSFHLGQSLKGQCLPKCSSLHKAPQVSTYPVPTSTKANVQPLNPVFLMLPSRGWGFCSVGPFCWIPEWFGGSLMFPSILAYLDDHSDFWEKGAAKVMLCLSSPGVSATAGSIFTVQGQLYWERWICGQSSKLGLTSCWVSRGILSRV